MSRIAPTGLNPDRIKADLKTRRIAADIVVYNNTSSTNDIAWRCAEKAANDGIVIFAEEQTAGRGRGTNKWVSSRGLSLLFSIVLLNCCLSADLLILTCAVAVAEAIGKCGRYQPRIRWPNDIMLNNRKVAGILLESKTKNQQTDYVLGIGINCHQKPQDLPGQLRNIATSIDIESKNRVDRNVLAKRLLVSIDDLLIVAGAEPAEILQHWRSLSSLLGKRVLLNYRGHSYAGNCIDLDPQKGLVLQLERGGTKFFDAAHTTIVRQQD